MNTSRLTLSVLLASAMALAPSNAFPAAEHDQTSTERILKENRDFIEFINTGVSNFARDRQAAFGQIYEGHFNADIAYLRSKYKIAYEQVYKSQGEMRGLYEEMVLKHYLDESKSILDRLAPGIIRSKSARARLYLTLGYRDRTVSWVHYTVGDASNPKLYSYKLYKYVDAIKMARRAKRFAFLALFESQTTEVKKKIYNQLFKTGRDKGNRFMERFIDLEEQPYIDQLAMNYEEYEKAEAARAAGNTQPKKPTDPTFEKKVEKRVRFRNETKAARCLMDGEFDQAEDYVRPYVEDFNYRIIEATFEVLAATAAKTQGGQGGGGGIDFEKFKVNHADNYSRIVGTSIMDSVIDTAKVIDDMSEKKDEPKTDGGATAPEKKEIKDNKVEGKLD